MVAVATFGLMELAGFLFPASGDLYYVNRVYRSCSESLAIAERFGDESTATEYRERVSDLESAYGKKIAAINGSYR